MEVNEDDSLWPFIHLKKNKQTNKKNCTQKTDNIIDDKKVFTHFNLFSLSKSDLRICQICIGIHQTFSDYRQTLIEKYFLESHLVDPSFKSNRFGPPYILLKFVKLKYLHCWRLWMKLSTFPCSCSIASIIPLRSGQAKQVLKKVKKLHINFVEAKQVEYQPIYIFWRSWTHFNEVWMVSSTWPIASLTWKRRRWIHNKQFFSYASSSTFHPCQ